MSENVGYQPGLPFWVDTFQPDPDGAIAFYTELSGWEIDAQVCPPMRLPSTSCASFAGARLQGSDRSPPQM
jgi:hypothetical protein